MLRALARGLLLAALILVFMALPAFAECGIASWYDIGSLTATGERFQPDGITAAHKTLPFGSRVIVRNQRTGKAILVRINDRGPFIAGRIIDLSRGAKRALGMDGLAHVCLDVISYGPATAARRPREFAANAAAIFRNAGKVLLGAPARVGRSYRRIARQFRPHSRHHGRHYRSRRHR